MDIPFTKHNIIYVEVWYFFFRNNTENNLLGNKGFVVETLFLQSEAMSKLKVSISFYVVNLFSVISKFTLEIEWRFQVCFEYGKLNGDIFSSLFPSISHVWKLTNVDFPFYLQNTHVESCYFFQ